MKNKIFVCIIGLFLISNVFCQTGGASLVKKLGISIPSPNAQGLGLYGEMPVSYFTGVPNISVPIYQVKGNKINLPIEITYHASGLKPEVHPGWVGNGWSLSAGGVISRKVNGNTDEFQTTTFGKIGYYYNYSLLSNSNWSSDSRLLTNSFKPLDGIGTGSLSEADTEPDEFDFNFLGYSGKFFLDQNGQWQVQSDKYLKVIFSNTDFVDPFTKIISGPWNPSDIAPTFGQFTILDETGNQYIFGSKDSYNTAIEFSDGMSASSGFGSTINATSWFLTKIISTDATETIILNYERGPLTSQLSFNSIKESFQASCTSCSTWGYIPANFNSGCNIGSNNAGVSGTVIFPVYLKSISMPCINLKIDFSTSKSNELKYVDDFTSNDDYKKMLYIWGTGNSYQPSQDFPSPYANVVPNATISPAIIPYYSIYPPLNINNANSNLSPNFIWLKLDAITFKNYITSNIIKTINFTYNNNLQARLQLNNLSISDNNIPAVPIQIYSFTYNKQTALPGYLKTYTDHWGFNNNQLLPSLSTYNVDANFESIRTPDLTGILTQAEILTSIKYPTGGLTSFSYEPNTYSSVVYRDPFSIQQLGTSPTIESGIGGGLRIKQITNTNGFGIPTTKMYYYVKNYSSQSIPSSLNSSGVLDTKPIYTFTNNALTYTGSKLTYQFKSNSPVMPMTSTSAGTLIGYSTVIEKLSDGSYSLYEFSNHDNNLYKDLVPVNKTFNIWVNSYPPSSLAFERGKLLHKADFTPGIPDKFVSENFNTYTTNVTYYGATPNFVANALYNRGKQICGSSNLAIARSAYLINYFPFVPASQTSKSYSSDGSGNNVSVTNTLTYDTYKNLVRQQNTNSKGQLVITTYKYPYQFASSDPLNPYSLMVSLNNVSKPIEKIITVGDNVVAAELYTYKINAANKVFQDAVYVLDIDAPLTTNDFFSITAYKNAGQLSFDSRYKLKAIIGYDNTGNISTVNKTGNDATAYLWDYNQQQPVAKVANASNLYSIGSSNNPVVQSTSSLLLTGTLYNSISCNFYVGSVTATGTINLSFAYQNPYISGNNYSSLGCNIAGITNPAFSQNVSLCATTQAGTCSSGTNTISVPNLPVGSYKITATLVSVTGFSNYYGYQFSVQYPSFQAPITISNNEIGYNSFEYTSANELNYGAGNWTGISYANVRTGAAVTGNNYYLITGSMLTKSGLDNSKKYIVSYWSNNGPLTVSGSTSVTTGQTLNFGSWVYYEHLIANSTAINVSGTGANIDELRIYPQVSQMTTYTYQPLIGMTSQCDVNNAVTYYEYDSFNRLKLIRDKDKNILKQFEYKY